MAIVVKLEDLLYARRMTLTELASRVDITLANLSILKAGTGHAWTESTGGSRTIALPTSEALSLLVSGGASSSMPDLQSRRRLARTWAATWS
jgi:putative transcriptional regulator